MRMSRSLAALVILCLVVGAVLAVGAPSGAVDRATRYQQQRELAVDGSSAAVDRATGDLYVFDDETVRRYSPSGRLLASWSVPGGGLAGGIDVGPDGKVYVVTNDRVRIYSSSGSPVGTTTAGVVGVRDVAVSAAGEIYVTDIADDLVIRYSAAGREIGRWGGTGASTGRFATPYAIAVGPGGVYVGEWDNHRVQRFGLDGRYLGQWGQTGTGQGQFDQIQGIATDSSGAVYVADASRRGGRVQVFTSAGGYVTALGAHGAAPFDLFGPWDVDVDASGRLAVTTTSRVAGRGYVAQTYAPVGLAQVAVPRRGVRVAKRKIAITVRCVSTTTCSGTLRIVVKGKPIVRSRAYVIRGGATATVKVKITKKGLRTIRRKPVTRAVVSVFGDTRTTKVRR